jgi:hypothetical protein
VAALTCIDKRDRCRPCGFLASAKGMTKANLQTKMRGMFARTFTVAVGGEERKVACVPIKAANDKRKRIHRIIIEDELVGTAFRANSNWFKAVATSGREYGGKSLTQAAANMVYGENKV